MLQYNKDSTYKVNPTTIPINISQSNIRKHGFVKRKIGIEISRLQKNKNSNLLYRNRLFWNTINICQQKCKKE